VRYRALRSLHYITVDAEERVALEGDLVTQASPGKIEALLADGFVEEVKPDKASDKEGE
jgi:hypothetical protein